MADFAGMDAAALVAHNDAFRRRDASGGLVSLDEWARSDRFGMYVPKYATLAPRGWTGAHAVTQRDYTARLEARFPEIVAVVRATDGLCIAGGAAAWPMLGSDVGDVDLFLYGLAGATPAALWAKVHEVAGRIRAAFSDARYVMETMSEGLVAFEVTREGASGPSSDDPRLTIQLVLRAYASLSAILHGFDVPACCVGFDGDETHMTALGASALLYRAMVVNPAYQSPSYAYRLAKYFRRGCALVFVHMRPDALERGVTLALGGIRVTPRTVRGRLAIGDVEAGAETSDYAPEAPRRPSRYSRRHAYPRRVYALAAANTVQLASGKRRFAIEGESARSAYGRHTRAELAFASYAAAEPQFADVLPRAAFERVVDAAVRGAVASGRVNVRSLRRVLGLSESEIAEMSAAAASAFATGARRVCALGALAPFRAALVAKYDATPSALAWWIVDDPSRQFSATRDPRPASAREWYGAAFAERVEEPTKDETIDGLLARLGGARSAEAHADGTCALCLCDVARGAANSMTLECGHTFHVTATEQDSCLGLLAWLARSERATCPMCRRPVGAESAEPVTVGLELHVAW